MIFNDLYVNSEKFFSMGIEETTNQYYLSIPVSNGLVDYEEYYSIAKYTYEKFLINLNDAIEFANKCRRRELDCLLIEQPGTNRGSSLEVF